jgi:molybdenum cofactor biosynthesis enzyme MoaA
MNKNIQSIHITLKGYFYKCLFNQKKDTLARASLKKNLGPVNNKNPQTVSLKPLFKWPG